MHHFHVLFFLTLALANICHAQNSPQDYVNARNAARATVGVGNIRWDDQLAAYAQQYANERRGDCAMRHSRGPCVENLAVGSGPFMTDTAAVKMWVDEQVSYDYNSNTCAPGRVCEHYTRVVWRNSVRLGCARVQCNHDWFFVTCNYDPPGNWPDQRPYFTSDQTF